MFGCLSVGVQHEPYSVRRAASSVQSAACSVQRAACDVEGAACGVAGAASRGQQAASSVHRTCFGAFNELQNLEFNLEIYIRSKNS